MIKYVESLYEQEQALAKTLKTPFTPVSKNQGGVYTVEYEGKVKLAESLKESSEILSAWKQGVEPSFSYQQALTWKYEEINAKPENFQ